MPDGMYYNAAYPGHLIAMPQPLYGEDVTYRGDADDSIEGISSDLVQFLMWAAEPKMEVRKAHWCCCGVLPWNLCGGVIYGKTPRMG